MTHPLRRFDFKALDEPEFGEDSVREEIIAPILRAIGYTPSGPFRIVRSKRLTNPFVTIGTTKRPVTLVPDYVLYVEDRAVLVLDAKAPNESTTDKDHVAQAYSYTMNSDVRAEWFALCNGRSLSLFNVSDPTNAPRQTFELAQLDKNWVHVCDALAPEQLARVEDEFLKDFGIHLMKLGHSADETFVFVGIPIDHLAKWDTDAFRFTATMRSDDCEYAATFQINKQQLGTVLSKVPPKTARQILTALMSARRDAFCRFNPPIAGVNILSSDLATKIEENENEHYVPMYVRALQAVGPVQSMHLVSARPSQKIWQRRRS
jgi:hypothetical protein